MKYGTDWWGVTFIAETEQELAILVRLSKAEREWTYEFGRMELDESNKTLLINR